VVEALSADRPDPPFGDGVGVERLNRYEDDFGVSRAPNILERLVNLASRSRIRNLKAVCWSPRTATRLRACWAIQHPLG
jgi:hypothetical protein